MAETHRRLPASWTPPPPAGLQDLLDQSLDTEARTFERAMAMAGLVYRVDAWLEEFVAYCEQRGGTLGMNLASLKAVVAAAEAGDSDQSIAVEPKDDGSVEIRVLEGEERDRFGHVDNV